MEDEAIILGLLPQLLSIFFLYQLLGIFVSVILKSSYGNSNYFLLVGAKFIFSI
jgi:hypothetical protein